MIRLNLIEIAEHSASTAGGQVSLRHVNESESGGNKKLLTALAAAAFVVVASACALVVFGVPKVLEDVLPDPVLSLLGVEKPEVTPAGVMSTLAESEEVKAPVNLTIPQIVAEVNPGAFPKVRRTSYKDYLPLERIQYQKAALGQFLSFIQTATPDKIGFSDLVYEAPEYYYVRGSAEAPLAQRTFLERLKSVSVDFKTPPIPENAPATDITAFGVLKMENVDVTLPIASLVPIDSLEAEIQKFRALDQTGKLKFNGFNKPTIEDFGVYKRFSYKAKVVTDFIQIHSLLLAWKASPIRAGIHHAVLARSGKDIEATFYFDVFVKP